MIDLTLLKESPDYVKNLIHRKDPSFNADLLIKLYKETKELKIEIDNLRSEKNRLVDEAKTGITDILKNQSKEISLKIKAKQKQLELLEPEFDKLYLWCPNLVQESVPIGNKEENVVVKTWGEKPTFNFTPKNHVELGAINNWFDFEIASKMTGSNFALYKNKAVKLVYNLMLFMLNNNRKHGYESVLPPYLVNAKALQCASNFPRFADEVYSVTEDNLYLTPTAEVNLTNLYRDNIILSADLPIKLTAWTSCFRREAGNYGANERGLIRIHQFEKAELYTICKPDEAEQEQQNMLNCAETILQSLNLHYRVVFLAAQDCSFASSKTYDIEVWMPGQDAYKEVSSISNCTDFQSRRSEIRFRDKSGTKTELAYTLNGSSLALPRLMVALMETYQQEDGSIAIPEIIRSVTIEI